MAENFFGVTDTGRQRNNNEDAFIAEKVLNDRYIMACVIDGVGGYEGGEVAARLAREAILHYFSIPSGELSKMMQEALAAANQKIQQEKQQNSDTRDMACVVTLALVDTKDNKLYYAHVGDTRMYLYRDHSLIKITKDHSFVGFLEDSGRLTEEAAMQHPKRNEINKALGFDGQQSITADYMESGESPFLPGDLILLCSDGLTDMINRAAISSILNSDQSLEEKGRQLVAAANSAGGKDNITVVLVQHIAKPLKQKATKPITVVKKNVPQEKVSTTSSQTNEIKKVIPPPKRKRNNTTLLLLTLVGVVLLAALVYFIYTNRKEKVTQQQVGVYSLNPLEQKLADTLRNLSGTTLLLSEAAFGKTIIISDTLAIANDTLHLKGNGVQIIADSAYQGPAFTFSPAAKYILLDSLTLQNFDVGVWAQNTTVQLKNVRFNNCRVPVQYGLSFSDGSWVNGVVTQSLFFTSDSLPKSFSK